MAVRNHVMAVRIRPEVTILSVLKHLNYKPWFALAEFVDNSLQSFVQNRKAIEATECRSVSLTVHIEISPHLDGRIVIRDNAAGIAEPDFPRAFRPAEIPPNRQGLSEFGMGMKSAACWFASQWTVRTKALGESVERTVAFDIDNIVKNKIEEVAITERPEQQERHYTEVQLIGLGKRLPQTKTIAKLKDHLASIYRVFLRDGTLELRFNGERLSFKEPDVLEARPYKDPRAASVRWYKTLEFDFGEGQRVHGFAALRKEGSTTHAGFALLRRSRLVQGSADESYRPQEIFGNSNSYRYQRLFGELHVEGFDVSHTKDGFRWEDEAEAIFLEFLKAELEKDPLNLLSQAEGFRTRVAKKSLETKATEATEHVVEAIARGVPAVVERERKNADAREPTPPELPRSEQQTSEYTKEFRLGDQDWKVTVRTTADPAIGDWLRLADNQPQRDAGPAASRALIIEMSLVHPFVERFIGAQLENVELFIRFAAGLAVAQVAAADVNGSQPRLPLHFLNCVLRDVLSRD